MSKIAENIGRFFGFLGDSMGLSNRSDSSSLGNLNNFSNFTVDEMASVLNNYSNQQTQAQYKANKDLQQMAMDFNANQAQLNRDFQERLSNTHYQRAVQDLEKAGLNKLLAYSNLQGSLPSGSMASTSASSVSRGADLNQIISAAVSSANNSQNNLFGILKVVIGALLLKK